MTERMKSVWGSGSPPGTEGDQGLDDLESRPLGILPGIEEGGQPVHPVALMDDEPDPHGNQRGHQREQMNQSRPGHIEHQHHDD